MQTNGDEVLTQLAALRDSLVDEVGRPIQWPEPSMVLNLAARAGSELRIFKHIHQSCALHRENFVSGNQIKHLYLIDGFLSLATAENPVAIYSVARTMLELSAFLHEVARRLQEVVLRIDSQNWRPLGEKYFGLLIRARFATTNPEFRSMLGAQGVAAARLKPFSITNCIEGLASEPEHTDAETRYNGLCDFVHHNLSSLTVSNSGSGVVDVVRTAGGGELRHPDGSLSVTQYEYPVQGKADRAIEALAADFVRDARACIGWMNMVPSSPFPDQMIVAVTGNPTGLERL